MLTLTGLVSGWRDLTKSSRIWHCSGSTRKNSGLHMTIFRQRSGRPISTNCTPFGILTIQRHFQNFVRSPEKRKRVWHICFLVVDSECFNSYMTPSPPYFPGETWTSYGDYGGFFKLIDTTSYDPGLIAKQAPGYKNESKVLGSLIFNDLYPMIVSLVQRPRDLWLYDMWHPNQVYVGPCVETQEQDWEQIWNMRKLFWGAFLKWHSEQSAI